MDSRIDRLGFRSGQQFLENFKLFPARFQGGKIFHIEGVAGRIFKIQDLAAKIKKSSSSCQQADFKIGGTISSYSNCGFVS